MGWTKGNHDLILDRENYPDRLEGPTSFLYLGTLPCPPPRGVWEVRTITHLHLVPWLNMTAATYPTAMCFNRVYRDAFAFRSYLYNAYTFVGTFKTASCVSGAIA